MYAFHTDHVFCRERSEASNILYTGAPLVRGPAGFTYRQGREGATGGSGGLGAGPHEEVAPVDSGLECRPVLERPSLHPLATAPDLVHCMVSPSPQNRGACAACCGGWSAAPTNGRSDRRGRGGVVVLGKWRVCRDAAPEADINFGWSWQR